MTTKTAYLAPHRAYAPKLPDVLSWLAVAVSIRRERHALRALDRDALADIGYSATEAENEANRRFWDAPARWRR